MGGPALASDAASPRLGGRAFGAHAGRAGRGGSARPRRRWRVTPLGVAAALYFALVAFLAVGYILVPALRTAAISLDGRGLAGLATYAGFLSDPVNQTAVLNTLAVGAASTLTCAVVGIALAVYVRFFCTRHRRLLQILLMSPVMIPGVVIVVAFMQLYGESGMVTRALGALLGADRPLLSFGGFGGIVFVITYTQYVYFYLNVYTALQYVDANVVESVRSLGGGMGRVVRDAVLPVVRPAVIVSAMTTFVSAVGSYSAPALIGGTYRVLSTQIVLAKVNYDMVLASVEVMVLLAIGVAATALCSALARRYRVAAGARAVYWRPDVGRSRVARGLFTAFVAVQLVVVLLPVAVIFYLSLMSTQSIMTEVFPTGLTLGNYEAVLTNPRTFRPLGNSLVMALAAVGAGLALTLPVAYASRKGKSLPAAVLEGLLMLPWCMPASVIAIDLINVFSGPSPFSLGRPLIGTFEILPIAYAVMALPLLLNASRVAVGGVRENAEEAARSLGAGPARTFAQVVLPAIVPGVLAGAILAFVRTMGEYTMSALLYGVHNRPIAVSIVTTMQEYQIGVSMAYGALVIALCCVLLFAILRLDAARLGVEDAPRRRRARGAGGAKPRGVDAPGCAEEADEGQAALPPEK